VLRIGNRFRSWMRRRQAGGATPAALAGELPRMLIGKGTDAVLQAMNRLMLPLRDGSYGARVAEVLTGHEKTPCVLVAVPNILHYVIPCLALATKHVPVVLVLNGTRPWEEEILARGYPDVPTIKLRPVMGSMLPHGSVMDILLRHATGNFVLLDPDMFVFEPGVFAQLDLGETEIAAGAYGFTNSRAALTFPTTHLLALNVPAIKELMARHRIRPVIYTKTPAHLVEPLGSLGLGDHNFVKEYLPYYDPLNLILAMAVHDGYRVRVLDRDDNDAFHVGGVSYLDRNITLDYFNARLLALPFARPFADRYRRSLPGTADLETARARFVDDRAREFLSGIDRIVDRIAGELSGG